LRSISDYTERIGEREWPAGDLARAAHRDAAARAASRQDADATVARVLDDLIAEGGFDELLVGGVDAASWKLREALVALAEERLNAMTRRPEEKLIADLVTLEVECRFPALSDAFQTLLERFERDWGYRKSFAADLALTGTPISSGVVYALQREPGWSAARLDGGAPSAVVSRDDSRALRVPDHIAVRLYQDQPLVELTAWRPAESDQSVSARTWFALQDRARLVPFDSALAGPELLDQVFLSALVDIVVGAIQWREILIARFRSVFTARYQREGMGTPHWRDEAVAREYGGLKRASGGGGGGGNSVA